MFPRNKVTGVQGRRIMTSQSDTSQTVAHSTQGRQYMESRQQVNASFGMIGAGSANSTSINTFWNSQYQYMLTGLLPAEPNFSEMAQLALFYRDIYLLDNVCGSAIDIQSTFPFSDYDVRGLDEQDLEIYKDNLTQLNIRQMLTLISVAYLTDGFFCGSLIHDTKRNLFTDTLVHDALQCSIIPSAFFNMMPPINVQTGALTERLLNSNSPYAQDYIKSLPPAFIRMMRQGSYTLNPVNTLFVGRKTLTDRAYVSFLHRILPMYLIEKTMFRGTLVEASRRQRAMTHITAGDDLWTPTSQELLALVNEFQQAEYDPLGGWISTRASVNVNDVRPGGEFWKWTDMVDIMTPYKMRALGISEAYLSGDASYASAESAYSTMLESMASYRGHITHSVFDSTLFPRIAVMNGMYKNGVADRDRVKPHNVTQWLLNPANRSKLRLPSMFWHKSLEAKGEENTFEMLEQASEKGVPIPMKSWMAAASLDPDSLLKDLKEDKQLRARLEAYTGKDTSHEGEDEPSDDEPSSPSRFRPEAALKEFRPTAQSIKAGALGKRALLAREWSQPELYNIGKTGKKEHVVHNPRGKQRDHNAMIARIAARAERDPEYRMKLARANVERLGRATIPLAGGIKGGL